MRFAACGAIGQVTGLRGQGHSSHVGGCGTNVAVVVAFGRSARCEPAIVGVSPDGGQASFTANCDASWSDISWSLN